MRSQRWLLVGFLLCLYGCPSVPSLRYYIQDGIGGSIDELRQAASRPNLFADAYKAEIGWKGDEKKRELVLNVSLQPAVVKSRAHSFIRA